MERITYLDAGKWRMRIMDVEYSGKDVDRIASVENIFGDNYDLTRLRHLVEADRDGRCVVLPVPMHRTLLDTSDPIRPELLKNFRISATWDHCGIVFHSPWNIFLENIKKGHIRLLNEAAEAALKGELDG